MQQYNVTGMSCAACSNRVEKVVSAVPDVTSVSVSLLTNSMVVEGGKSDAIIKAVREAGYDAALKGSKENVEAEETLEDKETPKMKKRLIASLILLLPLMYVSMGHMMWHWPIPKVAEGNYVALGIYEMFLSAVIMVINQKFFVNGFRGLLHWAPNMDTLVAMGSGVSFLWSTFVLFAMTDAQMHGNFLLVSSYAHEFYFESAAMIVTLITVGKMLEAHSKGKTTDALKSLMRLTPKMAVVVQGGKEIKVPVEQVKKGDIFVVRPGESIPVDGMVLEGHSAVNESALTGESIPVDKEKESQVFAATINQSGFLRCEATSVGEDTTLSQIIQMVSEAAATKAPIAKVADRVSGIFVPTVILIAVVTVVIWMILGQEIGFALARGIAVLVISCPCALGLATPVAIMVGNGKAAKNGILFKTASSLEQTGEIDIVVLDKTGTITKGEPEVTDLYPLSGCSVEELVRIAYALEQKSEHPLAKAIVNYASRSGIMQEAVQDFEAVAGNGLKGNLDGCEAAGGNSEFIQKYVTISSIAEEQAKKYSEEGKTPLLFAYDGMLVGILAVADQMKPDSPQAIEELKNMGIHVVMLTGDNQRTADAIGKLVGVDEVIAGVMPDGKERVVRQFLQSGKTAMVGDGINDAPALTRADVGIAIGAGTDVAIDAADVVLMKNRLCDVPAAIRLSRAVLRNIHENLFWAFFYNLIGIPLAAGLWYPIFGWKLNPMFGAAAMSLSSFCVVTNALRLNLVNMYDIKKDKKKKQKKEKKKKEGIKMEKTVYIKGMMCAHCEATVKKALEALDGIESAVVSHESGTAVITLSKEVSKDVLQAAIEEKDFEFVSIQ